MFLLLELGFSPCFLLHWPLIFYLYIFLDCGAIKQRGSSSGAYIQGSSTDQWRCSQDSTSPGTGDLCKHEKRFSFK